MFELSNFSLVKFKMAPVLACSMTAARAARATPPLAEGGNDDPVTPRRRAPAAPRIAFGKVIRLGGEHKLEPPASPRPQDRQVSLSRKIATKSLKVLKQTN